VQNVGQTTAVQFGNALDPRGRANHPKPACARAHGNQVGTVLAKDQSVWSSRNIYTLITGHTLSMGDPIDNRPLRPPDRWSFRPPPPRPRACAAPRVLGWSRLPAHCGLRPTTEKDSTLILATSRNSF